VDGFTDPLERKHIEAEFHARRIQVVCSVRTLVMGVDWVVSCIIDAAPTRSEMLFCQRIGRGLRVNPPWADLIVLDHAGNSARLGLVDEIHHDQLLAGKAKDSTGGTKQKETPPPKVCPSCAFVKRAGELVCPACGWKTAPPPSIKTVAGELVEIGGKKKPKPAWSEKQSFYSQLIAIQRERGRSDGWVGHTYRKKLGDWPPRSLSRTPELPSPAVRNFVRSCDIAFSKSRRQEVQR
jgi:superfamily II DNA or RNA helicase